MKIVTIGAALAAALFALQSCGLPGNIPSLLPPFVPANASDPSSSNVFTFDNQPQTTPEDFYGFEIYYKFYDNTTGTANTQYQSDNTQLSSSTTGPSQLLGLGYRRAYFYAPPGYQQGNTITSPATPLIPVPDPALKTTSFQVTIDFTRGVSGAPPVQPTNFYPVVDVNGSPLTVQIGGTTVQVEMARYFSLQPGESTNFTGSGTTILEGFGSQDFAYDQGTDNGGSPPGDLPPTIAQLSGSSPPTGILLGLYAIAYGLVNLTTPIYSTPTPLGYITYTSPTISSSPSNPSNP